MTRAVEAGKIDRFGVSNASLADVEAVRSLAGSSLAARFEYVQNEYNLLATADAEALIPYCAEHGLRYTAFSPLAGGLLTGKYRFGEDAAARQPPGPCAGGLRRLSERGVLRRDRAAEAIGRGATARRWRRPPCASCSTRPEWTA